MIVPLFAVANAGIHLTSKLMSSALSSPITWGILLAYVLGKPIGVFTGSWIASRPALHGPRSPVSEPVLLAAGACAGIGFTVSLLVSSLAFHGVALNEARLGALASVVVAPVLAWIVSADHPAAPRRRPSPPDRPDRRGHPRPRGRGRPGVRPHPRSR